MSESTFGGDTGIEEEEKPRPAPMPELASIPTQTGTSRPNALSKRPPKMMWIRTPPTLPPATTTKT